MGSRYSLWLAGVVSVALHMVLMLWMFNQAIHGNSSGVMAKHHAMTVWLQVLPSIASQSSMPAIAGSMPDGDKHSMIKASQVEKHVEVQKMPGPLVDFFSSNDVDRRAMPVSNLNLAMLEGQYSGLPIKLRLYIDHHGNLKDVEEIAASYEDQVFITQLKQALLQTKFIPAKMNGTDVGSYQDIEFSF